MSHNTKRKPIPRGDHKVQEQILHKFSDIFDGIECLPGEYVLNVDPIISPVGHPPQR